MPSDDSKKNITIETEKFASRAKIDPSSIETSSPADSSFEAIDAGIVLRLDVQRFPSSETKFLHQLMLMAAAISPETKKAGLSVNHLCDIGILRFTTNKPEDPERYIKRAENPHDLWTDSDSLRKIWNSLVGEISRYEHYWLDPPAVPKRQRLSIAVIGMDYFNAFVSPEMHKLPSRYHSHGPQIQRKSAPPDRNSDGPLPPILFR